jgi:tetratricopeptide (TPR) repeat protein
MDKTKPSEAQEPTQGFGIGLNLLTAVVVIVIGLTALVVFKGRDIYHAYRDHRVEKQTTEAMELIKNERYEAASSVLQLVLRTAPDHPAVNRTVAELFVKAHNDPQTAISFLRRVINSNEGKDADRLRLGELLLQTGDLSEARKILAALPASEQTGRTGLELLAGIKRASGDVTEADSILRRALSLEPDDVDAQLQLAIMDEAQALDQAKAGAAEAIWTIARRNDEVSLKAIAHLAKSKTLTAMQSKELRQLIDQHPKAGDRERYEVIRVFMRLNPLEHDAVIEHEIARNAGRSPDAIFDFLRWLGTEGEYERLLKIIPAETVIRDPDVYLIYVDALSAAERWKELLSLVKTRKPPVTPTTVHIILAQCYAKLQPDMAAARRELREAFALNSRGEIPLLLRAAGLAESLNLLDLAVQGYTLVGEARPVMRLQMLEKVFELQQRDKDVAGLIETVRRQNDLRPRNQLFIDRLNYLRLVSGIELEAAFDAVIGFENTPNETLATSVIPSALLRALAAWRFGDVERVKKEIGEVSNPQNLPAGPRAVVAGLYAITGRDVESFRMAEKIPEPLLLDSERHFLRLSMQ